METETSFLYNNALNKKRRRGFNSEFSNEQPYSIKEFYNDDLVDEQDNEDESDERKGQKIRITEEKMSDALRQLQLEMNSRQTTNNKTIFSLTNELKQSIEIRKRDVDEFSKRFTMSNLISQSKYDEKLMQIVPWIPNVISEKIHGQLNQNKDINKCEEKFCENIKGFDQVFDKVKPYKIEEPSEKKNLLKRTFSQANKITIEELKASDTSQPSTSNNHYIIELASEELPTKATYGQNIYSNYDQQTNGVAIVELSDELSTVAPLDASNTKQRKVSEEDKMDL